MNDLHDITKPDFKEKYLDALDVSLIEVNNLIREHESVREKQMRLLDKYTKMIDIGTTPKEKKSK